MQLHQLSQPASTGTAASFVITKDWLERHATNRCGWTNAQMRALGLSRQYTGWKADVVGKQITRAQRLAFELGASKSKQPALQANMQLDATIAQLSAYARLVAARASSGTDGDAAIEFLEWLGEAINRLAPGAASQTELRRLAREAESYAAAFDARAM